MSIIVALCHKDGIVICSDSLGLNIAGSKTKVYSGVQKIFIVPNQKCAIGISGVREIGSEIVHFVDKLFLEENKIELIAQRSAAYISGLNDSYAKTESSRFISKCGFSFLTGLVLVGYYPNQFIYIVLPDGSIHTPTKYAVFGHSSDLAYNYLEENYNHACEFSSLINLTRTAILCAACSNHSDDNIFCVTITPKYVSVLD